MLEMLLQLNHFHRSLRPLANILYSFYFTKLW